MSNAHLEATVSAARELAQRRAAVLREMGAALDLCAISDLVAEETHRESPHPVLTTRDVLDLRGKPERSVRVLNAWCAFPGARVVE